MELIKYYIDGIGVTNIKGIIRNIIIHNNAELLDILKYLLEEKNFDISDGNILNFIDNIEVFKYLFESGGTWNNSYDLKRKKLSMNTLEKLIITNYHNVDNIINYNKQKIKLAFERNQITYIMLKNKQIASICRLSHCDATDKIIGEYIF